MQITQQLKQILAQVLNIDTSDFTENTPLLGAIPEFDSMAIMTLLMELENQFSFSISNAELEAEQFESVASLQQFISQQAND
ncbi:acyl carrier protein [Pseudoalteromonas shioyasakiensis]|uniref:acyl carrier protein n=1 Tax=Pseudoalteromonas shioyasakiensis TaxID=1190813 RepID=UPI001C3DC67C|nr:acyl carrier protein [Pseudoalteromonas shioyasakiensis]